MSTTLRIKIVMPASSGGSTATAAEEPAAEPATTTAATISRVAAATAAGGSTSAQEFLAMRRRQREEKRTRERRWKAGGVILVSATLVVSVFVFRGWQLSPVTAGPAPLRPAAVTPAPVAAPAVAVTAPEPSAPAPAALPPDDQGSLSSVLPVASAGAAPTSTSPLAACEANFAQQEWRAAIDSCTAAFESAPDGVVALKIAHAHWSRGNVVQAGEWARTGMGLGNQDPDALVLVGHAQRRAGERVLAIASYRRYLEAAPRGWHARKVRWLVRRLTTPKAASSSPAEDQPVAESDATGT